MRTPGPACVWIIALAVLLTAGNVDAQVYRWVDKNGKVHYSDKPPPKGTAPVEKMAVESQRTDVDRVDQELEAMDERRKAAAETETLQERDAKLAAEEKAMRDKRCEAARAQLADVTASDRQVTVDAAGNRHYLTDAEVAAKRAAAQRAVDGACR